MISIAINAARIALYLASDSSSTSQAEEVVGAATGLSAIEARSFMSWEDQPNDWESVCFSIAMHIQRTGKQPDMTTIQGFIENKGERFLKPKKGK